MYALKVWNNDHLKHDITKKAEGVKRSFVKSKNNFEDYVTCLNNLYECVITKNLIKSEKHIVNSVKKQKIALSSHDD